MQCRGQYADCQGRHWNIHKHQGSKHEIRKMNEVTRLGNIKFNKTQYQFNSIAFNKTMQRQCSTEGTTTQSNQGKEETDEYNERNKSVT